MSNTEPRALSGSPSVRTVPLDLVRTLVADSDEAVVVQDSEARVQIANDAALALFPNLVLGRRPEPTGSALFTVATAPDADFELSHRGTRLSVRRRELGGGWHCWSIREGGPSAADEDPVPAEHPQATDAVFLNEAGLRLAAMRDVPHTAREIAELAVPVLGDVAVVVLPIPRGRVNWWRAGRPGPGKARRPSPGSAPVLAAALAGHVHGARVMSADEVATLPWLSDVEGEVLAIPLPGDGEGVGALVVSVRYGYDQQRHRTLVDFAARADLAIARARKCDEYERALTGLQTTLVPRDLPMVPGAELAAAYRPARGPLGVGGDFYDVRVRADNSVLFLLGDVCGNGAEAAALTGRVRHTIAALDLVEQDPSRLLYLLNDVLLATQSRRFTTMVAGAMARSARGLTLNLTSGGHPPPLVLRRGGDVEEVTVPGTLVGILPHARFPTCRVELGPGELCLLYSDGITEARSGPNGVHMFGQHRLTEVLETCVGLPASEVVARVERSIDEWIGENDRDDIALLVVRAEP
ncbi:PP2C family protein-serine/threonine phosphatase [Allokutzneria oryzae]|uniref:PP2C family protein-serine/threonine phosphatase n=1 Tax=Allokutzneria oryzae TaxID=1378989 RepID=A0ABV5ZPI1_9PSEU